MASDSPSNPGRSVLPYHVADSRDLEIPAGMISLVFGIATAAIAVLFNPLVDVLKVDQTWVYSSGFIAALCAIGTGGTAMFIRRQRPFGLVGILLGFVGAAVVGAFVRL